MVCPCRAEQTRGQMDGAATRIRGLGELFVVGLATPFGSAFSSNHTTEVEQKQKNKKNKRVAGLGEGQMGKSGIR